MALEVPDGDDEVVPGDGASFAVLVPKPVSEPLNVAPKATVLPAARQPVDCVCVQARQGG